MNKARRPTFIEMETLMHWWLIVFAGGVLCCHGWTDLTWESIPSDEWHERFKA